MAVIDDNTIYAFVSELSERGVDGIDALLTFAHEHNIEPEVLGETVKNNPNLLSLIEEAAENLNLIEKRGRLQFD